MVRIVDGNTNHPLGDSHVKRNLCHSGHRVH